MVKRRGNPAVVVVVVARATPFHRRQKTGLGQIVYLFLL